MNTTVLAIGAVILSGLTAAAVDAQERNQMTGEQLSQLTSGGRTLTLGGPEAGYTGELRLRPNGTGEGRAELDSGDTVTFSGSWEIRGDQFCRRWTGIGDGSESCESWILATPTSVNVFVDGTQIGVNSW